MLVKTIKGGGFSIQASIDEISFLFCHLKITNETSEAVTIQPQVFVLNVLKPKRYTLFFEYPSRVSYQFILAGVNYNPTYTPMERTTVRSGTGRTVATIDSPDVGAKEEMKQMATSVSRSAFEVAGTIESKALRKGSLAAGATAEGDVYFEQDKNARELVLKVFISDCGFELPFSIPKH